MKFLEKLWVAKRAFELEFEKWFKVKLFLIQRQSMCTFERLYKCTHSHTDTHKIVP